jgi:hypothetical protein
VQPELEDELQKLGFVRPSGPGKSTRGWIHPDIGLGFEIVGDMPMGDTPDEVRTLVLRPFSDESGFRVLSVEDMIVNRVGQYASGTARDHLDQARLLYDLAAAIDRDYLERRIRTESMGDHGVEDLER